MRLMARTGGFTLYAPNAWANWEAFQVSQLTANSQFAVVKGEYGAWGIKYVPYTR